MCQYVVNFGHWSESQSSLQDRYRELMGVSRQWNDLLLRKRFGYGHDRDASPEQGGLALFCPACPQPGINTPPDWMNEPMQVAHFFQCSSLLTIPLISGGSTAGTLLWMAIFHWST